MSRLNVAPALNMPAYNRNRCEDYDNENAQKDDNDDDCEKDDDVCHLQSTNSHERSMIYFVLFILDFTYKVSAITNIPRTNVLVE